MLKDQNKRLEEDENNDDDNGSERERDGLRIRQKEDKEMIKNI